MKKAIFISGLFLIVSSACSTSKNVVASNELDHEANSIQNNLTTYFEELSHQNKFQGVVLVCKGNEMIFHEAYGYTDLHFNAPNQIDYSFRIGSVTKSFTSILIAQEVERGNLNFNTKISRFIPDYPRGNEISIEHLLSHTSGIVNYFPMLNEELYLEHSPLDLINYFKEKPLNFEPGENWEYSNSNYVLLGYFLEIINGKTFETLLHERIVEPLNLQSTGVDESKLGVTALGHGVKPDGSFGWTKPVDKSVSYTAGSILSSSNDLLMFSKALFSGELIQMDLINEIIKPRKNNYGLGFMVGNHFGNIYYGHNGGNDGFHANWKYYPELDLTTVILCNNFTAPFGKILGTTAKIIFNKPFEIPVALQAIELDREVMQKYLGKYKVDNEMYIEIIFDGDQLAFQGKGQDAYKVLPYDFNAFFLKASDVTLVFQINEEGEAIALEWDQGSGKEVFPKIK